MLPDVKSFFALSSQALQAVRATKPQVNTCGFSSTLCTGFRFVAVLSQAGGEVVKPNRLDVDRLEALRVARAEAGPTAELKSQVEAISSPAVNRKTFRTAWRVETRLDVLARQGSIRISAFMAAQLFSDDYHVAHGGTATDMAGAGGHNASNFDPSFPQVAAMSRVRRACDRLGSVAAYLLIQCACLDAPWAHTAKLLGCTVDLVKGATIEAIAELDEPPVKGRSR